MASDSESKSMDQLIASSRQFALDIYTVLAKENENCVLSLFSIYNALVLLYLGAKGKTADEIVQYLHLPADRNDLLNGLRALLDDLKKNPNLNTATEIFVEKNYKLKKDYTEIAKKYLDSESQVVNFLTATKEAENIINSWVSIQTMGKIQNLIQPGTLNEDTRLVLVNAVHFKDKWEKEFQKRNTRNQAFYTSKESSVQVPMMRLTDYFRYAEKESFKVLELLYKDKNFRMLILLPKEVDGLQELEQKITSSLIDDVLGSLHRVKVNVQIPKFKLENFIDLNDALKKLGINTMFDEKRADFSGIHEPEGNLYVSNVLHKAFVDVNEEGTEAAAVTAVPSRIFLCSSSRPETIHDFIADRPFVFYIFYGGVILFAGKHFSI